MNYCFVTWVTHNSRVSERMVEFNSPNYIASLKPTILQYNEQIRIAELIIECISRYDIEVITFNILPDHVHTLVKVTSEKELTEKIGKIKGYSSFTLKKEFEISYQIWARKFNRQWIKDERHFENVLNYIDQNHLKHASSWGKDMICGFGDELRAVLRKLPKQS